MRKRQVISLTAVLVILAMFSCTEKDPLNPYDPRNQNYVSPQASIDSGPDDGDTLSESQVQFTWSGNAPDCQFSYKLAYDSVFNTVPWSSWTTQKSILFENLDEDSYTFGVKARYPSGDEQDSPGYRNFKVNAYRQLSLLIKPCSTKVQLNQQFTIAITVEEVQNLMAAEINLSFSKDTLEIVQGSIGEGEFLKKNGGEVVLFDSVMNSQGKMEINLGIAGGTPPGISGSGTLAKITFRAKITGLASVSFKLFELRDTNNQAITVIASRDGRVRIE